MMTTGEAVYNETIEIIKDENTQQGMVKFQMSLAGYVGSVKLGEMISDCVELKKFSKDYYKKQLYDNYNKRIQVEINRLNLV